MAIAEMSKLNLIGMACDRRSLLDALHRTGAVEIKIHAEEEGLSYGAADETEERAELSSMEAALDILCRAAEEGDKARKTKEDLVKDGFIVSYSEFVSAKDFRVEAFAAKEKINALCDERNALEAELSKVSRCLREAEIYSSLDEKTGDYRGFAHTDAKLGTVPASNFDRVREYVAGEPLCDTETLAETADEVLFLFVCHKSVSGDAESVLSSCLFTACALDAEKTGRETYEDALAEREKILLKLSGNEEELYGLRDHIRPLKIYTDYMRFEIEKGESSEKMLETEHTFMLEAYVPKDAQARVSEAIDSCIHTVYYEYSEPSEDEMPPTLMRNKTVFANFETITNMYSPPNSREFDPTIVMAFFYSLFMGFIMADVGYGVIMLVAGTIVWYKTKAKKSGLNSLSGVFAVGGVFAMAMGALCNSWFGYSIEAYTAVIPDAQSTMWSFAGIDVPAVLIIAMVLGCVQLAAGYVCRTVQCMKRGDIGGGIWEGMTWTVFAVGACLALIGVTKEFHADILMYVGAIMAGVGLVAAMCTAGRKEKIVGKFTKGFGALYSIINFASDILSYARLYGLMLSGAVVAQLVTGYSIEFFASGKVGMIILAVIILLVGHGFNLAMGLLSAYIHDARLQYVEFYGKFFEGEGELFTPIGSGNQHIYLDLKDAGPAKTENSGDVTMAAENSA